MTKILYLDIMIRCSNQCIKYIYCMYVYIVAEYKAAMMETKKEEKLLLKEKGNRIGAKQS